MDVGGIAKLRVPIRWLMASGVALIIIASISWNIRQHRVIERQRQHAMSAEREAAEITAARQRKNAEWAASDARLQQLYAEIDSLGRINDRLLAPPRTPRKSKGDAPDPEQVAAKP